MENLTKEKQSVAEAQDDNRIADKKTESLTPSERIEAGSFGVSGSLNKGKLTEIRDDVYLCCCCCGSSTYTESK